MLQQLVFDPGKPTIELAAMVSSLVSSLSNVLGRFVVQETISLKTYEDSFHGLCLQLLQLSKVTIREERWQTQTVQENEACREGCHYSTVRTEQGDKSYYAQGPSLPHNLLDLHFSDLCSGPKWTERVLPYGSH